MLLAYECDDSSSVVAIAGSLLHQFTCFPSIKVQQHMLLAYECDDDGRERERERERLYKYNICIAYECDDDGHEGGNDRVDHC
jgi:hypothetical protein